MVRDRLVLSVEPRANPAAGTQLSVKLPDHTLPFFFSQTPGCLTAKDPRTGLPGSNRPSESAGVALLTDELRPLYWFAFDQRGILGWAKLWYSKRRVHCQDKGAVA